MSKDTLEILGPSVAPTAITPETRVIAGHRGGGPDPLIEQYDGQKWKIPAGREFVMPYGVALAIRRRAIVPGSRDPHSGRGGTPLKQKSYLYIKHAEDGRKVPEADRPEDCRPFTKSDLAKYGMAKEALARRPGETKIVDVAEVQAAAMAAGVDLSDEAIAEAPVDPAALAPIPASQHAGIQEARALAAEQGEDTPERRGGGRRR